MYVLFNKDWGWLALPDYPSMWLRDFDKAYRFASRALARQARRRWNEGVKISVRRI